MCKCMKRYSRVIFKILQQQNLTWLEYIAGFALLGRILVVFVNETAHVGAPQTAWHLV